MAAGRTPVGVSRSGDRATDRTSALGCLFGVQTQGTHPARPRRLGRAGSESEPKRSPRAPGRTQPEPHEACFLGVKGALQSESEAHGRIERAPTGNGGRTQRTLSVETKPWSCERDGHPAVQQARGPSGMRDESAHVPMRGTAKTTGGQSGCGDASAAAGEGKSLKGSRCGSQQTGSGRESGTTRTLSEGAAHAEQVRTQRTSGPVAGCKKPAAQMSIPPRSRESSRWCMADPLGKAQSTEERGSHSNVQVEQRLETAAGVRMASRPPDTHPTPCGSRHRSRKPAGDSEGGEELEARW